MTFQILELRNYLLKPNVPEHFIDYFEEHFIATQEAVKMQVLGQFRLIGDPDHFVWLRGFSDMQTRLEGLQSFYLGPVWKKYGPTANAMMIDSDNVLLLRSIGDTADLTCGSSAETVAAALAAGTISPDTGVIAIDVYHALPGKRDALIDQFQKQIVPIYQREEIQLRGCFVAEMSENTFPRLPVIQNEDDFVVITAYESETACGEKREQVAVQTDQMISGVLKSPSDSLLLSPTLRSPIRYMSASQE